MYLKSIEVQGFKSFANRMVFEFHNGITGIVGPNGSGKSNIGDAVRWVLGEQSAKQLRGGKMEDVIFAGTELRKPVSYASVSLTIDNSDHALAVDYDSVTITRKVFRSGESEYLINDSACRLKDINELFYDTGVGKEGYSIIGQGQIDLILSGKPEERRELFDEAAGIVKFKRRKNAAIKKLDDENNNLVRVNDILAELEKQVGPLEGQAVKAKEYLRLKEDLKRNDVNLFIIESEEIKNALTEANAKYKIVSDELDKTKEEFEASKAAYEEKEELLHDLNSQIDEYTKSANEAKLNQGRLSSQIDLLNEQIKSVLLNDEHLKNRQNSISDMIEDINEEKAKLLKERFSIVDTLNEVKDETEKADEEVNKLSSDIDEFTANVEDYKNEIFDLLNDKAQLKTRLQKNETLLEQINIRKSELTRKLINSKSEEETFKNNVLKLKAEYDNITAQINEINSDISVKEKKLLEIRDSNNRINIEIQNVNRKIISETSKLDSLKNIAERYDGYGVSIKKVMEQKDTNKGIIGVVADIIKTDKEYELAIETALGGSIQNIVTDTEDTAKKMVAFLKTNKFGRATFLPLSAVGQRNSVDQSVLKEKSAIGYADSLVHVDKEYIGISSHLLGRIVVVDNIDNALLIARKYKYSLRIVTLEGDQLNPGGSISGGAYKSNSNLLGRRREIEDLEKSIASDEKALSSLNEKLEKGRVLQSEVRDELENLRVLLSTKSIEQNTASLTYNQANEKHNEITKAYSNSQREQEEIKNQTMAIDGEISAVKISLSESDKRNNELTKLIDEYQVKIEKSKEKLVESQKNASELHIKLANITTKDQFAEENIKRVLKEINRLKEEMEDIENNLGSADEEIAKKKSDIEKITETLSDSDKFIAEYEGKAAKAKEDRETVTGEQKVLFEKREEISKVINNLEKEALRISSSIEKIEEDKNKKIDYMWEEYEITLIRAKELKDETLTDLNEIRKNISSIRSDIKKLGDVNVNAIEDYKEVSERYEFLKKQHDDLIEATDTLKKVIEDLDTGMRTQFIEKFQEIKTEFDKVFKELFGGGRGTIELEEDVDILEAGIKIISQPPGKKLQNMMQLSGGEKALTAISLLFAIQNLKPSPFCLLDEIEAALDDSNVTRYANYLHKLTKNTQFIVITHRRGTMAAADRLYGITMQEKGVSALVSVDLIEKQLDDKPKQ